MTSPDTDAARFPLTGMLALAAAAFLAVTSETLPTGLLPEIGEGLGATVPQVGVLVSIFAFTVVLSSTPLTALTRRFARRPLVVVVIVVLGLSALLMAVAPNYLVAAISRVTGGMAQGVFWAVVGAYAGHIVAPHQLARAVAITQGGTSLALIAGVPIGTILGHAVGWRVAFAAVGVLLVLGAVVVGIMLPPVRRDPEHEHQHDPKDGPRPRDPTVWPAILVCVLAGVIMLGNFTLNTYIAPFITTAMGLGSAAVGPMLFVGGISGAIGVVLVGTVLGRNPLRAIALSLVVTCVGVILLGAFAAVPPVAIASYALWSLAFGCLPSLLQTRLLLVASARFRDTSSAIYTTAFNVGIGCGGILGGVLYSALGVGALPWANLLLVALALVMLVVTAARRR